MGGIAPYRSMIRRLFVEKTPFGEVYSGLAWLFLGVANTDALLYDDEWQEVLKAKPDNFRVDYALSREQTNKDGGKMYIQDKVGEYADEVFTRMDNGAHMYYIMITLSARRMLLYTARRFVLENLLT